MVEIACKESFNYQHVAKASGVQKPFLVGLPVFYSHPLPAVPLLRSEESDDRSFFIH
jgi:hypothetical protein